MAERIGMRAITMQQPFAAAMVHGQGMFTRRGRSVAFGAGAANACVDGSSNGEWVAVHCGRNNVHLNNKSLMKEVRAHWPACPSDSELKAAQACIVGIVRIVDGGVDMKTDAAARGCFFLNRYDCSKRFAWRADLGRTLPRPVAYPKGQVQVWHLKAGGFTGTDPAGDVASLLALAKGGGAVKDEPGTASGATAVVKSEQAGAAAAGAGTGAGRGKEKPAAASSSARSARQAKRTRQRASQAVKSEPGTVRGAKRRRGRS